MGTVRVEGGLARRLAAGLGAALKVYARATGSRPDVLEPLYARIGFTRDGLVVALPAPDVYVSVQVPPDADGVTRYEPGGSLAVNPWLLLRALEGADAVAVAVDWGSGLVVDALIDGGGRRRYRLGARAARPPEARPDGWGGCAAAALIDGEAARLLAGDVGAVWPMSVEVAIDGVLRVAVDGEYGYAAEVSAECTGRWRGELAPGTFILALGALGRLPYTSGVVLHGCARGVEVEAGVGASVHVFLPLLGAL